MRRVPWSTSAVPLRKGLLEAVDPHSHVALGQARDLGYLEIRKIFEVQQEHRAIDLAERVQKLSR